MRTLLNILMLVALAGCNQTIGAITGFDMHETEREHNREAWEEQAAMGDAEGYLKIGMAYIRGLDGEQDYTKGTRWLCEAADRGDVRAYVALGDFYASRAAEYGIAPSNDDMPETPAYDALAYAWYDIALRNMKDTPLNKIGMKQTYLLSHMTPEITECARAMAVQDPPTPCIYGTHTQYLCVGF